MIYNYKCDKCKKVEHIELPIGSELPQPFECVFCHEGTMKHDFLNQARSQAVKIPEHFKAVSRYAPRINYTRDSAVEDL